MTPEPPPAPAGKFRRHNGFWATCYGVRPLPAGVPNRCGRPLVQVLVPLAGGYHWINELAEDVRAGDDAPGYRARHTPGRKEV